MSNSENVVLSIILPCYNQAKILEYTFSHLLKQHTNYLEWIFVNDGSVDNTVVLLNEFSKDKSFIKVISQPNKGPGAARNLGASKAQGSYLVFLDPDDYWTEGSLHTIISELKNQSTYDLFICPFFFSNQFDWQPDNIIIPSLNEPLINQLGEGAVAPIHSYIISKLLFAKAKGFKVELLFGEDWWLWIQAARLTDKIKLISDIAAGYYLTDSSLSKNAKRIFEQSFILSQEARNRQYGKYCLKPIEPSVKKWLLIACGLLVYQHKVQDAVHYFNLNAEKYSLQFLLEDIKYVYSYNIIQPSSTLSHKEQWVDLHLMKIWEFMKGIEDKIHNGDATACLAIFLLEFSSNNKEVGNIFINTYLNKNNIADYFKSKLRKYFG
jgi:glycosyltransferase involved in cell wall biosynthesis